MWIHKASFTLRVNTLYLVPIIDYHWFLACGADRRVTQILDILPPLFVTQLALGCVGMQLQLSNNFLNFFVISQL